MLDQELSPHTIRKLIDRDDPLILELGAHRGYETQKFLTEFPKIRIYCFEPDPRCIAEFKNNIHNTHCQLIEAAISNRDGFLDLNLSGGHNPGKFNRLYRLLYLLKLQNLCPQSGIDWDYSSSIKQVISHSKQYPWLVFPNAVRVKAIRLDDWVHENNISHIDFIWSDIQGAEKDMIEGASETLKNTDYLYTEYGETSCYPDAMSRDETILILKRHNFEIISHYSSSGKLGNLLFRNKRKSPA